MVRPDRVWSLICDHHICPPSPVSELLEGRAELEGADFSADGALLTLVSAHSFVAFGRALLAPEPVNVPTAKAPLVVSASDMALDDEDNDGL